MFKRVILFDIDGTLIDSNDAHVEAWHRAFAKAGYPISRAQIHAQVGKGADNLIPSLFPHLPGTVQDQIDHDHTEIYRTQFLPKVVPFPGAMEILRNLAKRGHTLVLASSASRSEVDFYVDLLDADGLLSGTTSKDDVGHSKPCPDIFQTALASTGRPANDAVVIGDSPYDVIASRRAGMDAIAVLTGGFDEADLRSSKPVAVYASVAELDAGYEESPLNLNRAGREHVEPSS